MGHAVAQTLTLLQAQNFPVAHTGGRSWGKVVNTLLGSPSFSFPNLHKHFIFFNEVFLLLER